MAAARLERLGDNLARTRLEASIVEADALTYVPPAPVDAVLLDAPCSATGTFRRHPDVLHRVRPRAIASLAERQGAMLARAAQALKPGGRLVYAVCSLEPEEGEAVAADFLRRHTGFAAEPASPDELPPGIAPTAEGWVRILPGIVEGGWLLRRALPQACDGHRTPRRAFGHQRGRIEPVSVAFRRESDEEHLEPKFERPIPPGANLVTARGAAADRGARRRL